MPKTLPSKNGQSGGDAVQQSLDVDIDHCLPVLDAQLLELRDRTDPGIGDQHIKLAMAIGRQTDERSHILSLRHVGAPVNRIPARNLNFASDSFQFVMASGAEHDLCSPSCQK